MIRKLMRHCSPRRLAELARCVRHTGQWPVVTGVYARFCPLPASFTFRTRSGSLLRIDDRDELTTVWHVFFSGEYSVPAHARSILDLGANIGAFAVWAAENFPQARIWSVEPFPSTFDRLKDNLGRNNFGDRVSCEQLAVCGKDGIVRFDATEGKRSYCRTILSGNNSADTPSIEVPALCLKSLLDRFDINQLDCLKMDVEGAEYEILLNADSSTLKRIKVITMEYHDESKTPPLRRHLENSGFRCQRWVSAGWSGLATFVGPDLR